MPGRGRAPERPWIILLTDRRDFGAPILAVSKEVFGVIRTTRFVHRARRFGSKGAAKGWLRKRRKAPRWHVTFQKVTAEDLAKGPLERIHGGGDDPPIVPTGRVTARCPRGGAGRPWDYPTAGR
jgi:hypothetical protein